MTKLGRVSHRTLGTPVIPLWVEDKINYEAGNRVPLFP